MILSADSEGPDQTARKRSLIWVIAVRRHVLYGAAQIIYNIIYNMRKCIFGHVHPAKTQISLCICRVFLKRLMDSEVPNISSDQQRRQRSVCFRFTAHTLIRLRACAGWSESSLAHISQGPISHVATLEVKQVLSKIKCCFLYTDRPLRSYIAFDMHFNAKHAG